MRMFKPAEVERPDFARTFELGYLHDVDEGDAAGLEHAGESPVKP
jgi:hypothetical protein